MRPSRHSLPKRRSRCSSASEDYLAFVAHDLRTPLVRVRFSARVLEVLLMQDRSEVPQVTQMWTALKRNVQHLEALVGKVILENSNLETEVGVKLHRREFDLWPLVEALIHDLHPVAGPAPRA